MTYIVTFLIVYKCFDFVSEASKNETKNGAQRSDYVPIFEENRSYERSEYVSVIMGLELELIRK